MIHSYFPPSAHFSLSLFSPEVTLKNFPLISLCVCLFADNEVEAYATPPPEEGKGAVLPEKGQL